MLDYSIKWELDSQDPNYSYFDYDMSENEGVLVFIHVIDKYITLHECENLPYNHPCEIITAGDQETFLAWEGSKAVIEEALFLHENIISSTESGTITCTDSDFKRIYAEIKTLVALSEKV